MHSTTLPFLSLVLLVGLGAAAARPPQSAQAGPRPAGEAELVASLADQGIALDPGAGLLSIEVEVEVENDLLEYLLVGPGGARHETAFSTAVRPSLLNVALLSLGVEAGTNARWTPREPPPTDDERRAGVAVYDITPPAGDGFYLYMGWRRGDEVFLLRCEDLLRNLATGQTMRRHRWVYIGSRLLLKGDGSGEEFAADVYQNLINVAWFSAGATLLTGALPECLEQSIWMSNAWLLPARGSQLRMVFARQRLESASAALIELLPDLGPLPSPYEQPGEER